MSKYTFLTVGFIAKYAGEEKYHMVSYKGSHSAEPVLEENHHLVGLCTLCPGENALECGLEKSVKKDSVSFFTF